MMFSRIALLLAVVFGSSKIEAFIPSSISRVSTKVPSSLIFPSNRPSPSRFRSGSCRDMASSPATTEPPATIPSWKDIYNTIGQTAVGKALNDDADQRSNGYGAAHVHNKLRKFASTNDPKIILYRDHAGWCPYCQKTMLLVEEKQIPLKIELINMRSYGDKPNSFLQKVPGGLLPALEVDGQVITESAVIMQLLDEWHGDLKPMVPPKSSPQYRQYQYLMQLERELFRWWCTFMFRPESGTAGGGSFGGALSGLLGGNNNNRNNPTGSMSPQMQGFVECLEEVNAALRQTKGPHVERMLASCAYWKGMDLRSSQQYPQLQALQQWLDALEKAEYYLAFKSDYYTHIKDIPPQYGPSYEGIAFPDRIDEYQSKILGKDGKSWTLPLDHDDELQPLYRGPPLPLCVLKAAGITADPDGSYQSADPAAMATACRQMAAWKLSGNGPKISIFSSRGGPQGANNPRKTFGAELADPYAESDASIVDSVDAALRITGLCLQDVDDHSGTSLPSSMYKDMLTSSVPQDHVDGVISSLAYLRDRIGVPRDLPLASARYLRAYLNWAIDTLTRR
ncbi:glutathione S-transferase [Nitzschia inconspicua]|uniref:Glutathione S-transferase n=1 Tax=Nitzschia inconspicua TaxID=303405 RepID=A0A9K3M2F1_9STRA|nr:glutathione S-transferase [Nitzschia inconspicua]